MENKFDQNGYVFGRTDTQIILIGPRINLSPFDSNLQVSAIQDPNNYDNWYTCNGCGSSDGWWQRLLLKYLNKRWPHFQRIFWWASAIHDADFAVGPPPEATYGIVRNSWEAANIRFRKNCTWLRELYGELCEAKCETEISWWDDFILRRYAATQKIKCPKERMDMGHALIIAEEAYSDALATGSWSAFPKKHISERK